MGKTNNNQQVAETVEVKEVKTPNGNTVQVTEKITLGKKIKNGIKEFGNKHPNLAKAGKVAVTGAIAFGAGMVGYALGTKNGSKPVGNSDIEVLDMDSIGADETYVDSTDEI